MALVTGAASGIGAESARLLSRNGASVVATDIDLDGAEALAAELTASGGSAIALQHDVSRESDWDRVIKTVVETFGGLDTLVNNAGIAGTNQDLTAYDFKNWRNVLGVNLDGVFLGLRYSGPAMEKRGGGSVINLSSILSKVGSPGNAAYCASKGAVTQLTKVAALEWAPLNIRVNSVHPGYIQTPLVENAMQELEDGAETLATISAAHPIGRLGTPGEIAAAVVFLASDDSSFMTGSELVVDGGFTAQ